MHPREIQDDSGNCSFNDAGIDANVSNDSPWHRRGAGFYSMKKNIKYKVGDTLKVETFAGPTIYQKVISIINRESKFGNEVVLVKGFEGRFVRRSDLYALKKHSVPYSGKEKLSDCISFTYDYQIISKIKNKK